MITEQINFDHTTGDIALAFGLTDDRATEITGSIIFTEIDKAFTAQSLYDNLEDAPREFTSKTGVLASVLDDVHNNEEALFATFEWSKHIILKQTNKEYDKLLGAMTMLYMLSGQDKNKFIKGFVKKINEAKQHKDEDGDDE
jgi:hypothetical protein